MPPPPSRYLPPDFDGSVPFALLAGKGEYPRLLAERAREAGVPLRLLAFEGETDDPLYESFAPEHRARLNLGQLGKALKTLAAFGCRHAVMAGQITPRRLFQGLTPDLKAVQILWRLKERNAETIYGAVAEEMAAIGVMLVDARAFMDGHIAEAGCMTARKSSADAEALAHGARIAREVARLDIGQGVVVSRGTVLAVEGFEGTNEMLRRAGTFGAKDMIFAKAVKPGQDYRIDVPVFGLRTLEVMREAGIRCAALEAGAVLMLGKPALLEQARSWDIELTGFRAD